MAIVRWDPVGDLGRFFEPNISSWKNGRPWDLAVDVYEDGDTVVAEMHLPGVEPKDLDVDVDDNVLRIKGSREEKVEKDDQNYYYHEIQRGSFERNIQLPAKIKPEEAKAKFEDGVLKIVIPKSEKTKPNRVKVHINK